MGRLLKRVLALESVIQLPTPKQSLGPDYDFNLVWTYLEQGGDLTLKLLKTLTSTYRIIR